MEHEEGARVERKAADQQAERAETERALAHHATKCPVAQTLTPCVQIEWEAEIREEEID